MKVLWNPVNVTTLRQIYFGRINGVVVLTGVGMKLQIPLRGRLYEGWIALSSAG